MSDWTPEAVADLEIRLRNGTLDRLTFDADDEAENQAAYDRTTEFFAHYRELRAALQFYAEYKTWRVEGWDQDSIATDDGGKRARAALASVKQESAQ